MRIEFRQLNISVAIKAGGKTNNYKFDVTRTCDGGGKPAAPEEYSDAFSFTGTLNQVTLNLSGELIPDTEAG